MIEFESPNCCCSECAGRVSGTIRSPQRRIAELSFGDTGASSERRRQMSNMKSIGVFLLATACLFVSTDVVVARAIRIWSYQELLEESDLVVIATPTANNDTQQHIDLPSFDGQRVISVNTTFTASGVLKGDKVLKGFCPSPLPSRPRWHGSSKRPDFCLFCRF